MPPKKNADKTEAPAKTAKEKAPRKRQIKEKVEKPKLNRPTIVKIKLPSIKRILARNSKNSKTSLTKSTNKSNKLPDIHPAVQRKIDLANEVAQAQLGKPILDIRELEVPKVKKKGRAPKKKNEPTKCTKESKNATKPKPVCVKKKQPETQIKKEQESDSKTNATNKRKADSTSEQAVKRRSKRIQTVKDDLTQHKAERMKSEIIEQGKEIKMNGIGDKDLPSPSILDGANLSSGLDSRETNEFKTVNPAPVDSRKTSSSECLSWTRDISSSSTTTCLSVGFNDFFRIDKKLPVVILSNIDNNIADNQCEQSDSDSSSESSDSSDSSSSSSNSVSTIPRSLNLSKSSISPTKSVHSPTNDHEDDKDWESLLNEASLNLRKIDANDTVEEYENENVNSIQRKILDVLKLEHEVLELCKRVKIHFLEDIIDYNKNYEPSEVHDLNDQVDRLDGDDCRSTRSKQDSLDQFRSDNEEETPRINKETEDIDFTTDQVNLKSYEDTFNDDDDALSLFAESITDMESSRYSSANSICANASELEEYIPQPISKDKQLMSANYVPTKISGVEQNYRNISVKKQNADSTSINKLIKTQTSQSHEPDNTENHSNSQSPVCVKVIIPPRPINKKPILLSATHNPLLGVKSVVFRGVCFYNLISNCKKIHCNFPHKQLEGIEMANRLSKLTDELFIQEYMLMRNWPNLRRQYGLCYVMECVNRKLTRVLIEMTIDYISKAKLDSVEDAALKIDVTERTLLYLNNIDLNTCSDLLEYDFNHGILLCDVYMQTIAESQNFSRFKLVFIKLTFFINKIGRKFTLDVASHILERVSILPCEEPLVRSMLIIIRNTEQKIFENCMINQFEKQLSMVDKTLFDEFNVYKEQASLFRAESGIVASPQLSREVDQNQMEVKFTDREERYMSPDTTKLDNATEVIDEQIHHPVKIIRPSMFNQLFKSNPNSPINESPREHMPPRFRNWRGENIVNLINVRPRLPMLHRPMRPPLKRLVGRHVAYGPTPPKFPRPGPEFY